MSDLITQPPSSLPISVGAVSETGHREQNQDCMTGILSPFGAVYLIADGMGGHRGGAEASRMVTESFSRHLLAAPPSSPPRDAVTLAVRLANLEVMEKGKSGKPEFEGMGSTVAIALIRQSDNQLELITAHVGDSRVYLQHQGKLTQLTKDHSQVQWLVDTHALDEASARNHPDASVLTRAIGHATDLQVDISDPIPLQEGDGILLCSDGLSGFAGTEEIARTIEQNPDPTRCASQLVQLALDSGSTDNITVQFLRIGSASKAPSRNPARETQPDGVPLADAPRSAISKWLLIVAAAFLSVGVVGWQIHTHRLLGQAGNPEIIKLGNDVEALREAADKLNGDAQHARDTVSADLSGLQQLGTPSNMPTKQRSQLAGLTKRFPQVGDKFEKIVNESGGFISETNVYDADLQKLNRPAGQAPTQAERQLILKALRTDVPKSQENLKRQQEAFAAAQATQNDLEHEKSELMQDQKTAEPKVHRPATKEAANTHKEDAHASASQ